ncbi:unnamed protein product, partial [Coregonus sp. 'balchen']
FIGRRGNGQVVSLSRNGCIFLSVAQHELLHALGFNHEQTRSDRDSNVQILTQNIIPGKEFNFRKINTINLGTPYDYNSVMHYSSHPLISIDGVRAFLPYGSRFAFSRNRQPTILPIPDNNAATQMSPIDILPINSLYNCITIATPTRSMRSS